MLFLESLDILSFGLKRELWVRVGAWLSLVRALVSGTRGRGFKSPRPDHSLGLKALEEEVGLTLPKGSDILMNVR